MRLTLLSLAALLSFAMPALAEDIIALPPEGHTILNLSVTERTKVTQDTLSTNMRYEMDGGSANEIQDAINKAMKEALAESKKFNTVKTSTGNYNVYAYNERNMTDPRTGRPIKTTKTWRGSQSIMLESKDSTALLELAGKIQEKGFLMDGLNHSLSVEKSESLKDELMTKALEKLGARAAIAAKALKKGGYDIVDINIDQSIPQFPVYRMAKMATMAMDGAESMEAPVAQAGESDITMTISARVLLKP